MKILLDMSSINRKNAQASIPSYINRLVESFQYLHVKEIELLVDKDFAPSVKGIFPDYTIHTIKRNYILYRLPFFSDWYSRFTYKKALSKIKCDAVLIASDQDRGTTANIKQKKIVVIHDLKGIRTSCSCTNHKNKRFYQKLIGQASSVVTISEFTKKDVLENLNIPESKIKVIYNCVHLPQVDSKMEGLPAKYILYVNTLLPYKNLLTLLKAYLESKAKKDYKVVVVGKQTIYWNKEITPIIEKNSIQDNIIRLENLTREELNYVYKNASLFVTTSIHEGFGYTPIEAAMNGIPVISSTCEALPDTTQNLLNYYEPAVDYHALANKIDEILNNPPSQEQLSAIAQKFQKDFAPTKQAEQFISIFNSLSK